MDSGNPPEIRRAKPPRSSLPRRPKRRFRLFPVWFRLGFVAYRRSYACSGFGCEGGGRDFAWLTLLLTLVTALALLLVTSRTSFLDRMTDALLGSLRPYGVPVWVTSHWQNHDGIGRDTLAQVQSLKAKFPHLQVHPYRRLEGGRPRINLPGTNSWSIQPKFVGWAVYPDDPLWQLSLSLEQRGQKNPDWLGLPLEIVLNERLFARHFDYRAYREELLTELPADKRYTLPERIDRDNLPGTFSTLWMRVTVGQGEQFLPFRVRWIPHIPAMEEVAFLFPLTTYHALLAAYHLPDLKYDPLQEGGNARGDLHALYRKGFDRGGVSTYVQCIQEAVKETGLTGVPMISDSRCPRPESIALDTPVEGKTDWDAMAHDAIHQLWLPCHKLARDDTVRGTICPGSSRRYEERQPQFVPWDVTGYGTAFATLHVYVPARSLTDLLEQLKELRVGDNQLAFNIHPKYQDALNRFNLLNDVLTHMVPAFALVVGSLLAALLLAQIGTLLGHRKHHYGMLMTRGMTWMGIHFKVYLQMSLAMLFAGGLALWGTVELVRIYLDRQFADALAHYRELLNPSLGLEGLPMPWLEMGLTLAVIYVTVLVVTFLLLIKLPLRWGAAPSDLLHGE
ncbi:hypothetical protein Mmc1_3113 [Magnetococcus marinus MC-1]|uniref:Uncharacterized protein n=1 Tax=Magnetococcus marinus (strain ATCC BAA-1437 / JCM 17883 / MC-1) TaxID=156889 RepID=A0LCB0_MAGMM|nr:hypothetical protein [Magnetococcus marinus]ABK45603.1 hypothetical protein Mmc1_3113 [Magnetococcus marinus MC-1]